MPDGDLFPLNRIRLRGIRKRSLAPDRLLKALPDPASRHPACGKELAPEPLHFHLPESWETHLPLTRGIRGLTGSDRDNNSYRERFDDGISRDRPPASGSRHFLKALVLGRAETRPARCSRARQALDRPP